ncbi:hypothetical protein BS78_06G089100 [Paspalum vaginatum]|nr:hypothetical protein BS78_06G089100 [Paspalum vaginatum]KAJ1270936.1 hypothetical protein BS78_06G089100 [Paspalum vaginatum]
MPMPLHCAPVARKVFCLLCVLLPYPIVLIIIAAAMSQFSMLQLRFGMARLNWPAEQTNFFITILADECRAGNRMSTTLNQTSKDNVVRRMKDHTDRHWTWDMCRNKWDELKKKWSCWKYLYTFSCLGYHPRTSVIQMPQAWWDARIKEKKIARVFKRIRLQREEDLDFIFVGMEPVNIGPNEDGGHEGGGGRAGVPTQYVDSDNSGELEADHDNSGDLEADHDHSGDMHRFSPPPPQPLCTASMTSASCGKRRSIDQMHSSSSMLEGFKHFYEDVSAWKKQKEASSASKKAEEDAEYETLLRELLDGGVDPESEEYYMASVVLENTAHRAAYRPLPTIKAKIAWIKRAYLRLIGQLPTF